MELGHELGQARTVALASDLFCDACKLGDVGKVEHACLPRKAVKLGGRRAKLGNVPAADEVGNACMALPRELEKGGTKALPQFHRRESIMRSLKCVVADETAVFAARSMMRAFAGKIGFAHEVIEELVVVVSELASNILKYGRRGYIELSEIERGIEIVAHDESPTFDLIGSLRDGYDSKGKLDPATVYGRRGIGAGLGAVARLSDRVEQFAEGTGKRIVVRRTVGRPRRGSSPGF